MIRIPGPGRIENRAANPYLACAAVAAGLDGIELAVIRV
jgi:glutamine synthetase